MLFNIEHDSGDTIIGYVVPDGYAGEAQLVVQANGKVLLELRTDDLRPALVAAGRHETGRCGFILTEARIPSLATYSDLEIFESSSGILIYRRPQKNLIQKKILRIDTHLFPFRKLDINLYAHFQYYRSRIEIFGKETVDQLFLLNSIRSIFLSGRIMYRNYQQYIDGNFSTFIVLQDPYEELAERILIMKILSKKGEGLLSEREKMMFAPAVAYFEDLSVMDPGSLKRQLMAMPRNIIAILSNPLVRQLTVSSADEMPQRLSVASALDMLSTCELVGFRHEPAVIGRSVAEMLGLNPTDFELQDQPAPVKRLGTMLKDLGIVDGFLEKDVELFEAVLNAAKVVR